MEPKESVYDLNLTIEFKNAGNMKDLWGIPMETNALSIKIPNTDIPTESEKNSHHGLSIILWVTTLLAVITSFIKWRYKQIRVSKFYTLLSYVQYYCFMQFLNIKFPKNLQTFFTFFNFKVIPMYHPVKNYFTMKQINIAEPESPMAF